MTRNPAPSLRRQLLVWLLVATAVFGVLALIDTYREAVKTANTVSDRVLAGSALAIAERVVVNENGALEVDIPYVALEMLTSAAQDRVFYRVEGPPGHFITGYQALPTITGAGDRPTAYADASFRGEAIRVAVLHRSASTGVNSVPFVVTVAETTIARRQLAQAILFRSALRLALMITGAAAIVWIAVTLALRPLYRLSDAIAERSPDDLHPIEQQVPQEVEGLVETVNSFMVRLQSALNSLRHFSGNASHQLRTPLAIIRTQLALATRAGTLEAAQDAARKGDAVVAHAERILAQLLLMAKIDAAGSAEPRPLAVIDVTALAQATTADYVPLAAQAGIDLGFEGELPAPARAEPLLFGEMLRNLIENAIAYAGPGSEVTVSVKAEAGRTSLQVVDNGPGIPADRRAEVLQRFARGGLGDAPGMGLGLPIVQDIAALFGATLALEDNPGGRGLCATITFPANVPAG